MARRWWGLECVRNGRTCEQGLFSLPNEGLGVLSLLLGVPPAWVGSQATWAEGACWGRGYRVCGGNGRVPLGTEPSRWGHQWAGKRVGEIPRSRGYVRGRRPRHYPDQGA